MATIPTKIPVPSESPRDLKFNAGKIDQFVTSVDEIWYTDRFGRKHKTMHGIQQDATEKFNNQISEQSAEFTESLNNQSNQFQNFLLNSGYQFLGDYQSGPFQFSARNQYIRWNNQYYRLNAATDTGFTTTGTDAASFANDVTRFVLMDGDTLRQELSASGGWAHIGGIFSQEGWLSTSRKGGRSLSERRGARGQFDVNSSPWEKKASVGMTFGGDKSRGTILLDDRGRMTTQVHYSGLPRGVSTMFPTVQNTGRYQSGWPVKQMFLCSDGYENEDQSPSLIVGYDENQAGLPQLWVANPSQFDSAGWPYSRGNNKVYTRLASIKEAKEFSPVLLPDNASATYKWLAIATFNTGTTNTGNNANAFAKFLLTMSHNQANPRRSYLASWGNTAALATLTLNASNISKYFSFTGMEGEYSNNATSSEYEFPQLGVVQSGTSFTVYLRMPYWSYYNTLQALQAGANLTYDYENLYKATMLTAEPAGIIYVPRQYAISTQNTVKASDGTLLGSQTSRVVRIATGANTSGRNDIAFDGFTWSGAGTVSPLAAGLSITRTGTGVYVINGASTLSRFGWSLRPPYSLSGDKLASVTYTEGSSSVTIRVTDITSGSATDVPSGSWVDVHLA